MGEEEWRPVLRSFSEEGSHYLNSCKQPFTGFVIWGQFYRNIAKTGEKWAIMIGVVVFWSVLGNAITEEETKLSR